MPRGPRFDHPGAFHHVMNRGARRQAIFLTDHDRRSFLSLLADAADEFEMRVLCVCLMDNHFHLLVQSMGAKLSQAMRHVGGIHALRFNEHNGTDGPLFRGRFRSLVVADDDYLLTVARYIDHNPVAAGLCADPADYRWSTHRFHAGLGTPPRWLSLDPLREMVGGAEAYRRLVGPGPTPNDLERYATAARSGVLGPKAFAARLTTSHAPDRPTADCPIADAIDALVADHYDVATSALASGSNGIENQPRLVAVSLVRKHSALSPAGVATRYGFGSTSSVRSALRRHPDLLTAAPLASLVSAAASFSDDAAA